MSASFMSVIAELRQTTRIDHEAVERLVDIDHPAFSVADYGTFLEAMLAAHEPFEHAIATLTALRDWLPDITSRNKAALLRTDLRALGRAPAAATTTTTTVGEALGALYVLEGSTLGARFVLARLRSHLGDAVAGATHYLEAYGETRAQRWQVFAAALDRAAEDSSLRAAIIAGAGHMFARVRVLLGAAMPQR